jgi:CRP-like cAMP-binding protein
LENLSSNRLLAVLTEEDRARLAPHIQPFDLGVGSILQTAGEPVRYTWFPCGSALASFRVDSESGETMEVALVGREGAVGGIVSNGDIPAFATASVCAPGQFLRIRTAALEQVKLQSIHLRHWFARYSDCLLAQVFQTAACNAQHTILQRACKWLLAAAERTESNEIEMTQEDLAALLGAGRTFVNRVLGQLRAAGALDTGRGRIIVRDPAVLRRLTCDCSTAIENHFDRVLEGVYG